MGVKKFWFYILNHMHDFISLCRIFIKPYNFWGNIFTGVFTDSPTDFVVDTRDVGAEGEGKVSCLITNPSGVKVDNYIKPLHDGTYKINYSPFEGQSTFLKPYGTTLFFNFILLI